MGWLFNAVQTISSGIWGSISNLLDTARIILWDTGLSLINTFTPKKGLVAADWPDYVPRTKTDSRSPCPGINTLSNHGLLPHDGRNITFKQLAKEIEKNYNYSPTFCYFVSNYLANILKRDYHTDTLDLSDICVHNGIEHDGSMTRRDTIVQPDQSIPDPDLIDGLFAMSKDGKKLTAADLSRYLSLRLAESKRTNSQFSLTSFHLAFGAGNAATLLLSMDGEIEDIRPFLLEERIPVGWKNKMRSRMGLSMAKFNSMSLKILLGADPSWKKVKKTT
ncbi:heme-thiolate peroxidase [Ramaria rubella]|nr:heme-thiolate peroxidase [Ramaria rubella]KAF8578268.1 heme-thiolate peroxidase [Ramaria rubella]